MSGLWHGPIAGDKRGGSTAPGACGRASLALDGLDYFDLTPTLKGDDLRAVVARGVDGTVPRVFVGPPWVAAELCARLAVEVTRWRMRRHARRLASAEG